MHSQVASMEKVVTFEGAGTSVVNGENANDDEIMIIAEESSVRFYE